LKTILNWIKDHKILTVIITVLVFALPLVVVHFLFKWHSGVSWLEAEWLAGDVLGYIAGFEALLGTVVLGFITVDQSDKANEANERLSKENNYLQKISIQQMLPLLKVADIAVHEAREINYLKAWQSNSVQVSDRGTSEKREPHIVVYPQLLNNGRSYFKEIELTLENISAGPISQISIDRIEFSGFKYKDAYVDRASCVGVEQAKYISWLILPGDQLKVIIDIYFDNELYKDFWEFDDFTSIGCFDICLYVTNKSLSGIDYKEKIYIEKCVGIKERIMYKAYEGETNNA
jgi:hypothetical protein